MFNKKDDKTKKFEKVPQIEIDGETYHETAEVALGVSKVEEVVDNGGNKEVKKTYSLKKYVMVRGKVFSENVLRTGEGAVGKAECREQWKLEIAKELKRMDE